LSDDTASLTRRRMSMSPCPVLPASQETLTWPISFQRRLVPDIRPMRSLSPPWNLAPFSGSFSGRSRRRTNRVVCIVMETPNPWDVRIAWTTSCAASVRGVEDTDVGQAAVRRKTIKGWICLAGVNRNLALMTWETSLALLDQQEYT
jgi:hypothetical protein